MCIYVYYANLPDLAQDCNHDNIMACTMQMKVSINVSTVSMYVSTIHVLSKITGFKTDTHNMQTYIQHRQV